MQAITQCAHIVYTKPVEIRMPRPYRELAD